jgi:L-Ala-D/L-Glu epimerase
MESLRIGSAAALIGASPFRFTFRHTLASRSEGEAIILRLAGQDGQVGFGECAPRSYVSGETLDTVREALGTSLVPRLAGAVFSDFEEAVAFLEELLVGLPRNQHAAFCALELALLDLAGKRFNRSAGTVLGPVALQEVRYSAIVSAGGVQEALQTCEMAKRYGFRSVKVKVGSAPEKDLEVLGGARRILGDSCSLRADANCAWDLDEALRRVDSFVPLRLDGLEQPLPPEDLAGLASLTRRSPIPIIADESLVSQEDARKLADQAACHCFNIRISKCGGLLNSLRIRELGRQAGIACMLGAQVGETALLSAAGRHFATRSPDARFLEGSYGSILLEEDIGKEDLTVGPGGRGAALPGPGLGVEVDEARLSKWIRGRVALGGG